MLLDLGTQRHDIAVQRDMDVLLGDAGHLGQHGVELVGLLHVDLDLLRRRQRVAMQRLDIETGRDVAEEIVEQAATVDQGIHGFTPCKWLHDGTPACHSDPICKGNPAVSRAAPRRPLR
jgi:hypothetical protein